MSLEDLGDKFPMNQIIAESYTLDKESMDKINNFYSMMNKDKMKLEELNEIRQNIENLKGQAQEAGRHFRTRAGRRDGSTSRCTRTHACPPKT